VETPETPQTNPVEPDDEPTEPLNPDDEPDVDPEPETGDFSEDLPLDENDVPDGDDNDVAEELRGE
jgi:hypothetical protein